jgi:hypothetical protein
MANTIARSRSLRSAAMSALTSAGEDLREHARHPHQRHLLAASAPPASREPTRYRVGPHRRVTPGDQVRVQARDRRQAPGDRAGRQPPLAVADPNHPAVTTLMGEEVEHICGDDLAGCLPTTPKNVFRSCATARSVFARARPATNARYESTSGSPNAKRASPPLIEDRTRHGKLLIPACSSPPARCTGIPEGSHVY